MSEFVYILDSSAMLCVIFEEPGIETVESTLNGALVSAVNLAEVVSKLKDRGMPDDAIDKIIAGFKIKVIAFDESSASLTGKLRNATRARGLSLADRACLALAIERGGIAVTTDRVWEQVESGARILVAR